ncbi:MAG: hypothetical protein BWY81_00786 [Firmicutes bacterium ADurb.Bin467]|nr:MAG: hypothetical protein BWY81_00786 [Firmicutes bacterium ADurb.Bin467]
MAFVPFVLTRARNQPVIEVISTIRPTENTVMNSE